MRRATTPTASSRSSSVSRGGRIAGGAFPAVRTFAWPALALGVLIGTSRLLPDGSAANPVAPAGAAPVVVHNHFPEIKLPEPVFHVAVDTPYTRKVAVMEAKARQGMVARAQRELNNELMRATTKVSNTGRVVTSLETPALFISDCEDDEKFGYLTDDGEYVDGVPFPGNGSI